MSKLRRNQSGMTLVSILTASAIAAVVVLMVTSILSDIFSTTQRAQATVEVENAMRLVTSVLMNSQTCNNALSTGAGRFSFSGSAGGPPVPLTAINRIEMNNGVHPVTGAPLAVGDAEVSVALALDQVLWGGADTGGGSIRVEEIGFREINPGQGRGTITRGGVNFRTYQGELVVRFAVPTLFQGSIRERSVPLCIATDAADVFSFCCSHVNQASLCDSVGGQMIAGNCVTALRDFTCGPGNVSTDVGEVDCPSSVPANCQPTYYIKGFGDNLRPTCACQITCAALAPTPPGSGPSGSSSPFKGF